MERGPTARRDIFTRLARQDRAGGPNAFGGCAGKGALARGAESSAHPVTLVMESLFDLLPPETAAPVAMTPPMQRVAMIPEKTEFPFHDAMRRLFNLKLFPSAGVP